MFEIFNDGESEESHVVDKFNQLEQKLNRISIGDSVLDKLKNDSEGDV
jgi:hypothetical protein